MPVGPQLFLHTDAFVEPADGALELQLADWPKLLHNMLVISIRENRLERFLADAGPLREFITTIQGINGNTLNLGDMEKQKIYQPMDDWNGLTRGQVGCFQSHRKAWRHIVQNQLPHGFILEDDCDLSQHANIVGYLNEALNELDFDWDILYISRNPALCKTVRRVRKHIVQTGKSWGLFAYVVTQRAAQELLRGSQVISEPVDVFVSTFKPVSRQVGLSPLAFRIRTEEPSDTLGII